MSDIAGKTILATFFHAPYRHSVEVLEETVIAIAADGQIDTVIRPGEAGYDTARESADLTLPDAPAGAERAKQPVARLATWRGTASAEMPPSVLAGVPLTGSVGLRRTRAADPLHAQAHFDIDGSKLNADGHTTRRGRPWNPTQVKRVLDRAAPPPTQSNPIS